MSKHLAAKIYWKLVAEQLTILMEYPVENWDNLLIDFFLKYFEDKLKKRKEYQPNLFELENKKAIPTSIHYDTFVDIFQKRKSDGNKGTRAAFAIFLGFDSAYDFMLKRKFSIQNSHRFTSLVIKYDLQFNRERLEIDQLKTTKVTLNCMADELGFVVHRVFNRNNPSYTNFKASVKHLSGTATHLSIQEIPNIPNQKLLYIIFNPPLKKDDSISYELTSSYENTNALTFEDFEYANKQPDINANKNFSTRYGLQIYPLRYSESISLEIQFPQDYFIENHRCSITKLGEEVDYVQINPKNYQQSTKDNRLSLCLNIQSPFVLMPHTIFWQAPTVAQLLEAGYINFEEAERIYKRCGLHNVDIQLC